MTRIEKTKEKHPYPVSVLCLPSPPKSKQSVCRQMFQQLMASKYAAWCDSRPRRERRAAAWLEAKARTAMTR